MKILINSTPTALWYDIIQKAESTCATPLKEELESYLVFLLMRYTDKPEIIKHIIADEFLKGVKLKFQQRQDTLKEIGDKCLIFSGLFPNLAEKRLVKISYYVQVGQAAFGAISKKHNDTFHLLSQHFVPLMDILQTVRCYSDQCPDLLPLRAYELWNETGSKRALSVLQQYTQSIPLKVK